MGNSESFVRVSELKWPQNIYNPPIGADISQAKTKIMGKWTLIGTVQPTFGKNTVSFPLYAMIIRNGRSFKYKILVNDKYYFSVRQNYEFWSGDVVDIYGMDHPTVRWRVNLPYNDWRKRIALGQM